ncbi:MAG: hypothetical protein AAFX50_23555, partial [Acidobacteriota bacterium]
MTPTYPFLRRAGRVLNSGQARALLLTGNIHDLFFVAGDAGIDGEREPGAFLPLVDFLKSHWEVPGKMLLVYELNGPIRFAVEGDRQ